MRVSFAITIILFNQIFQHFDTRQNARDPENLKLQSAPGELFYKLEVPGLKSFGCIAIARESVKIHRNNWQNRPMTVF